MLEDEEEEEETLVISRLSLFFEFCGLGVFGVTFWLGVLTQVVTGPPSVILLGFLKVNRVPISTESGSWVGKMNLSLLFVLALKLFLLLSKPFVWSIPVEEFPRERCRSS